jgi:predicted transcriptional regulator of viral defense system
MKTLNLVDQLLNQGDGILFASVAVQAGLRPSQLTDMVNDGILERTNRGIYIKTGDIDDALFSLQQRAKKIVYSHETALFLHGLTDRTPFRYSITVPASYRPSNSLKVACKIYYIKVELIGLGKTELASGLGHKVVVYDRERTLCDIVRSRNKLDKQVFLDALKGYAARPGADLNLLYDYAEQFGISRLLQQYLEVLL